MIQKIIKAFVKMAIYFSWLTRPKLSTSITTWWLKKNGAHIDGHPNYFSAKIWFDGGGYHDLSFGDGITISSNVRILTHDWALHTIRPQIEATTKEAEWLGIERGITIGANSFVGTGAILLPGTNIGKGCIIGAGTVVRGNIKDFSLVIGNPCQIVADTREYYRKKVGL